MKIMQVIKFNETRQQPELILNDMGEIWTLLYKHGSTPTWEKLDIYPELPEKKAVFFTVAIWPEESGVRDEKNRPISREGHTSFAKAYEHCLTLEREGFMGKGKYFPIRVYTTKERI